MRYLPSEHSAIRAAVESAGLDFNRLQTVKKRGRLHLYYGAHPDPFAYFRKKATHLSDDGHWTNEISYLVFVDGGEAAVSDWESVMERFRAWLARVR